jgi:Fe-S cluster biogenesis protein NfuA
MNQVFYEATPNPQAMKFVVTKNIANETAYFEDAQKALRSPLASKLFGFPWAQAVMIGPNFVTITKQEWVDWTVLADPLSSLITEHLDRGEDVLLADVQVDAKSDESAAVQTIKHVLNSEIRPAVAMDGGDIVFNRYEDGVVYVHMQGSCAGCPSSTMTLKQGIEARLKEVLPEIKEVVAV